ncbi:MAG: SDR family oxidoreductase [Bacteroidales bacterium]|jgi:NAD(P)-dependent dehydrogenase (short-subunit alcohol dehydrogenase family)|nr:SDR family oxidoreductase [Bacteroidales bacterium]
MNIIVTGASRGIGYETVKQFAAAGQNKILAVSRNIAGLEALRRDCEREHAGSKIIPLAIDITGNEFESRVIREASENLGRVDILLNNAGALVNKPMEKLTDVDFNFMFNVNVKSVFLLIKSLLPYFRPGAHIVNISSMGGIQGSVKFNGLSLYSASKGALAVLTECMALELKDRGISVNCLALGAAQTEMLAEAFPGYQAPLSATEMAGFIADFSMNGHKWFNGKILPVALSTP